MLLVLGELYFVLLPQKQPKRDFCVLEKKKKKKRFILISALVLIYSVYFRRGALGNLVIPWLKSKRRNWRKLLGRWLARSSIGRHMCRTTTRGSFVKNILLSWPEENPICIYSKFTYLVLEMENQCLHVEFCPGPDLAKWQFIDLQDLQNGNLKGDFYSCFKNCHHDWVYSIIF